MGVRDQFASCQNQPNHRHPVPSEFYSELAREQGIPAMAGGASSMLARLCSSAKRGPEMFVPSVPGSIVPFEAPDAPFGMLA